MSTIDKIRRPIENELKVFKEIFAASLQSSNPILSNVNEYILNGVGKQLRPILAILAAKLCADVSESTYYGALSLELLHNASLMHDDVIDDTDMRRGRESVNSRWTNKVAVLSGDYMLSNSLAAASKTQNLQIMNAVSNIGMELSDGELLQLVSSQQTKITKEDYFTIIRKKTALLFATCAQIGGLSVRASKKQLEDLWDFGEYLGICFQIKDDVFDYYTDLEIGKPTGNDLQDGKITLPLIYALEHSGEATRDRCLSIIENNEFSPENIEYITQYAHNNGGVAYANKLMAEYKNKAIEKLNDFPNSDAKNALILCAEYSATRKK
jgi:octaprenyl-diphosphate synthase